MILIRSWLVWVLKGGIEPICLISETYRCFLPFKTPSFTLQRVYYTAVCLFFLFPHSNAARKPLPPSCGFWNPPASSPTAHGQGSPWRSSPLPSSSSWLCSTWWAPGLGQGSHGQNLSSVARLAGCVGWFHLAWFGMCVDVFACVYIYPPHVCLVPAEVRGEHLTTWTWSYGGMVVS